MNFATALMTAARNVRGTSKLTPFDFATIYVKAKNNCAAVAQVQAFVEEELAVKGVEVPTVLGGAAGSAGTIDWSTLIPEIEQLISFIVALFAKTPVA